MGANERVNFALIGCGLRGRFVARGLIEQGANLAYICDLEENKMASLEEFLKDVQSQSPKRVKDMRHIFDDKDIDAVAVVTPDHWHALPSVLACQAGKDVYVEKPHAYSIWESNKMVEAAKKYNRIVQVGTQNRSAPYVHAAKDYVLSGKLGKIGLVKVYNLKSGNPFLLGDPGNPPADFDWDAWLGPAPDRQFHQDLINQNHGWSYFWDYCNGDSTVDGIHQLDLAMAVLGDPDMPETIFSSGGRFILKDDAEVPDVQAASYMFDDFILNFEMTNYARYMQKTTATIRRNDEFPYWTQNATRIEIYGSELMMTIGRMGGGWQVVTSGGKVVEQMYGRTPDANHYRNFIECVKSRKESTADIRIAHKALAMILAAIIAYRTGNRSVKFDRQKQKFINDEAANMMLRRIARKKYEIPEII
ncbi:Gfo/Idh/MocA family oxidoreductase [candidate division KSB1 bacterium]|nr:Gfo/Idh/MocA family oxidoreductase [candidate division KSB1 bacterium]